MLVVRKANWYRPYYVIASGREYKVEKIHFYKDNKILVTNDNGWLIFMDEYNVQRDIEYIELPIEEIKTKRKEKFDGSVFVISQGKESYSEDLLCELYIPSDMFDIQFVENITTKYSYGIQVKAIYKGTNNIYIESRVKFVKGDLHNIENQYEEVYKDCSNLYYHTEDIIEKLDKLKALAEQYIEEDKRLNSLTIDELIEL